RVWDLDVSARRARWPAGDDVSTIAVSRDRLRIGAGRGDGKAIVWDAATGRTIATVGDGDAPIDALAFGGDDRVILAGSPRAAASIWTLRGERERILRAPGRGPTAVDLSADGARAVTAAWELPGGATRVWDVTTGAVVATMDGDDGLAIVAAF